MPNPGKPYITLICANCGEPFAVPPYLVARGRKHCSWACRQRPSETRFWEKVNKDGPVPDYAPHLGPCWLWMGSIGTAGYGLFWLNGTQVHAPRYSWELANVPMPHHLVPDHLCRVHACIRPDHLEAVTYRDNFLRGFSPPAIALRLQQCQRGHSLEPGSPHLRVYNRKGNSRPRRWCYTCHHTHARERALQKGKPK